MFRLSCVLTLALCTSLAPILRGAACGDADGNGIITISDVVYAMEYTFRGGPPFSDFDLGDFDHAEGWTVRDGLWLASCMFGGCDPSSYCPPTSPPLNPPITSGFRLRYPAAFPAHRDQMVFDIALDASQNVFALQLPLRILIEGGDTVRIDSLQFPAPNSELALPLSIATIQPIRNVVILGHVSIGFGHLYGSSSLARLFISAPINSDSRLLTMEYADYVPAQAPPEQALPMAPLLVTGMGDAVKPSLYGTCCIVPGDANGDGIQSISDAVYLITYYFGGGPAPAGCSKMGDADGNGILTISDAIWIINYIFAGGPDPLCT